MDMLTGKSVLVTGATDGLGKALAFRLAERGARVLAHGRNAHKGEEIASQLEAIRPVGHRFYQADFSSLKQVRRMGESILAEEHRIDVLINNAGIYLRGDREVSSDGYELTFQVDYLAGYLITKMLAPLLRKAAPARIVMVASAGQQPIDFDDVMLEKSFDTPQAYRQAKLAQIMMAFEMADELSKDGITINALHPATHMPTKMVFGRFDPKNGVEEGVDNVMRLAASNEVLNVSGTYFKLKVPEKAIDQAYDRDARAKLMKLSTEICGI